METWKNVTGYEGLYEVSDQGNVRSLDRVVASGKYTQTKKGKYLKKYLKKSGYYVVPLSKDGKRVNAFVHKLVATEFLDNPNGFTEVNHIDHDKLNNEVYNLEWCDHSHNMKEMRKFYGIKVNKPKCITCNNFTSKKGHRCKDCYLKDRYG